VGARVVEIGRLLLAERGLRIDVANVEGALDVMLETRARQRENVDHARRSADPLRTNTHAGLAIDDQLAALGVEPHGLLQGLKLAPAEVVFGHVPQPGSFGDMGIAVKGRKILGHWCKLLNAHREPPFIRQVDFHTQPVPATRSGIVLPNKASYYSTTSC